MYYMESRSPFEGAVLGERTYSAYPKPLCGELCQKSESIEMLFPLWTRVGRRKHVLQGDTLAQRGEYN